eukprot:CAMPEP_0118645640 /NCGR_PEP_ID=MMETSP0785-20121206/7613_1 /TAXON_ID=91992 /ORGANISM="Bolidomonas pacifica, Strain CCMP 1866" /LENGTH=620 /DNA_ID=CAMNT_0006537545 /DNA_START=177 /DNA_END=2035 /DNA_ORIENTATION=-
MDGPSQLSSVPSQEASPSSTSLQFDLSTFAPKADKDKTKRKKEKKHKGQSGVVMDYGVGKGRKEYNKGDDKVGVGGVFQHQLLSNLVVPSQPISPSIPSTVKSSSQNVPPPAPPPVVVTKNPFERDDFIVITNKPITADSTKSVVSSSSTSTTIPSSPSSSFSSTPSSSSSSYSKTLTIRMLEVPMFGDKYSFFHSQSTDGFDYLKAQEIYASRHARKDGNGGGRGNGSRNVTENVKRYKWNEGITKESYEVPIAPAKPSVTAPAGGRRQQAYDSVNSKPRSAEKGGAFAIFSPSKDTRRGRSNSGGGGSSQKGLKVKSTEKTPQSYASTSTYLRGVEEEKLKKGGYVPVADPNFSNTSRDVLSYDLGKRLLTEGPKRKPPKERNAIDLDVDLLLIEKMQKKQEEKKKKEEERKQKREEENAKRKEPIDGAEGKNLVDMDIEGLNFLGLRRLAKSLNIKVARNPSKQGLVDQMMGIKRKMQEEKRKMQEENKSPTQAKKPGKEPGSESTKKRGRAPSSSKDTSTTKSPQPKRLKTPSSPPLPSDPSPPPAPSQETPPSTSHKRLSKCSQPQPSKPGRSTPKSPPPPKLASKHGLKTKYVKQTSDRFGTVVGDSLLNVGKP